MTARKEERKGDTERAEQREIGDLKELVSKQKADTLRLEEKLIGECRYRDDRITKLEQENAKLRGSLQEMEVQARQARSMQEQLKQTRELLGAMTAQFSEAQTLLSTADRLSEMEVLDIVRDLNENIYQVAIILTGEWEKLEPSQATGLIEVDLTSQSRDPVLIQLARKWDLTGLTFLLQSFLCRQAVDMTSSWAHSRELGALEYVYQRLSASSEYCIINTKRYVTYVPQKGKQSQPDGGRWPTVTSSHHPLVLHRWWSHWRDSLTRQARSRPLNSHPNSFARWGSKQLNQ